MSDDNIIYEIVADCQEWIINSEYKELRGPASTLVKFIVHSNRKYEWVSQAQVIEASKLLTEVLGYSKIPFEDQTEFGRQTKKFYGPSMHCKACGASLHGKEDLCTECLQASKEALAYMLKGEGYSWNDINECLWESAIVHD